MSLKGSPYALEEIALSSSLWRNYGVGANAGPERSEE